MKIPRISHDDCFRYLDELKEFLVEGISSQDELLDDKMESYKQEIDYINQLDSAVLADNPYIKGFLTRAIDMYINDDLDKTRAMAIACTLYRMIREIGEDTGEREKTHDTKENKSEHPKLPPKKD